MEGAQARAKAWPPPGIVCIIAIGRARGGVFVSELWGWGLCECKSLMQDLLL
jgi:hypothetical protein